MQLDGLEEDEWELRKLEELKEQNEKDIQKEAFRVVDWDRTRAKTVYQQQAEALHERLEIERRLFLEAEQRKQNEYLRILTEQQASHDAAAMATRRREETTTTSREERIQAVREKLWSAKDLALPWSKEEDFALCVPSEALLHGILQNGFDAERQRQLTFPNDVGKAIALVFHRMRKTANDPYNRPGHTCRVKSGQISTTPRLG